MAPLGHSYVTAFFGQRDSYQAAIALAEVRRLDRLVTDLYLPSSLAGLLGRIPWSVARKAASRHAQGLPSRRTRSHPLTQLPVTLAGGNQEHRDRSYRKADLELGRLAARRAARSGAASLIYSYHWEGFLSAEAPMRAPRILFQVHPLADQIAAVLQDDRR